MNKKSIQKIKESSINDLKQANTLFGLEEEKFKEILTDFSSGKITKNEEDTEINRDYISKELYSKLFNYLIGKINEKMKNKINKDDESYRINILDIFGFENLENNSFEQLYKIIQMKDCKNILTTM